ncbi:hypothetical protein ACXZ65_13845 [Streptomyces aculeolatus]
MLLLELHDVLAAVVTDKIPNPGPTTPKGLTEPRDLMLGIMKWGGFAIAAGSLIFTGIKMLRGNSGGRGATTAADAVADLPMQIVGTLFIGGIGAGVLGMFL